MRFLKIIIPVGVLLVIAAIVIHIAVVFTRREETGDTPLVNTTVGVIRGLRAEDGSAMFLGIPYAIIDDKNPFGAATPNPTFEDVFNAINDNARCPQLADMPDMSLDCLHLHIHVPRTADNNPLPVFVYIHGGLFKSEFSGRKNFGPQYLIKHNVIFVALNYRLAAYGFMCLRTAQVPGNQGLKDQLLALRWIKNNIKSFGGDADSITIVGNSAGAICVDSHLLFAEEGLFHKVIILSGTSLKPTAYPEPDLVASLKIARELGFVTKNTSEAVTFLSTQTPQQVLAAAKRQQIRFRPCVEKEFPNVEGFAISHPVSTPLKKAKNIPIIAGHTEDESVFEYFYKPAESYGTVDTFDQNLRTGFIFGAKQDAMKSFVRRFYAGDEPISYKLKQAVIDSDSDFNFIHPIQRYLMKYLDYGGVAYYYVFSYVGGRNMLRFRYNITEGGACHADDLGYFLKIPGMRDASMTPDDDLMVDRITTLLTNFAKYGNPTPTTTELLPVQWLPVTRDRLYYLNLTTNLELRTRPFHQRISFWDLFYHTNREHVRGFSNESLLTNVGIK